MSAGRPQARRARDRDNTGARIGGYRLITRLGAGGLAEVYLAEEISTGRCFAIKRLLPHREADPRFVASLGDEARLAGRVDHPGVVRVERYGEEAGQGFVVMELVDGVNLAVLVEEARRRGLATPMPAQVSIAIVLQSARALAAVHRAGVVHGDVTPANLIVMRGSSEMGGGPGIAGHIKLCDFGVSWEVGATTAALAGSPGYLAPERRGGIDAGSPASDVYALGVCAWEFVAGRSASEPLPTALAESSDTIRHPPILRACGADGPLVELIDAMLDPDPLVRPSASFVADQLDEHGGGEPSATLAVADWLALLDEPRSARAPAPATITLVEAEP